MPYPLGRAWLARLASKLRSTVRGLVRRGVVEADMQEEFQSHIEMRTADLMHEG